MNYWWVYATGQQEEERGRQNACAWRLCVTNVTEISVQREVKFGEKLFQTKLLSRLSHKLCRLLSSPDLLLKFTINTAWFFFLEPGPAATMVGNIVMGTRIGGASGREIADIEEDSDMAKKVNHL